MYISGYIPLTGINPINAGSVCHVDAFWKCEVPSACHGNGWSVHWSVGVSAPPFLGSPQVVQKGFIHFHSKISVVSFSARIHSKADEVGHRMPSVCCVVLDGHYRTVYPVLSDKQMECPIILYYQLSAYRTVSGRTGQAQRTPEPGWTRGCEP